MQGACQFEKVVIFQSGLFGNDKNCRAFPPPVGKNHHSSSVLASGRPFAACVAHTYLGK
jgi:hypothetical protein